MKTRVRPESKMSRKCLLMFPVKSGLSIRFMTHLYFRFLDFVDAVFEIKGNRRYIYFIHFIFLSLF